LGANRINESALISKNNFPFTNVKTILLITWA